MSSETKLGRRRVSLGWLPHVVGVGALFVVLAPALSLVATLLQRVRLDSAVLRALGEAVVGSLILVSLGLSLAVPLGIAAGVHVATHPRTRLAKLASVAIDILSGVPSIVVGVVAYALVVLPTGRFSVPAGAVALALVAFPEVARSTTDLVASVPTPVVDTALSLGVSSWRVTTFLLLRARGAALVASLAAVACRSLGEVAPLLFTTASGAAFDGSLGAPMSSLAVEAFLSVHTPDGGARAATLSLFLVAATMTIALLVRRRAPRSA